MRTNRVGIVAGVAALATLAAPAAVISAAAAASPEPAKRAVFDVTVSGVQTTEWAVDHQDPPGLCSRGAKGKGGERVTFASMRPTRVALTSIVPGMLTVKPAVINRASPASLPILSTRATVLRNGYLNTWVNSVSNCRGTGGDGSAPPTPPAKDCGRRTVDWDLDLNDSLTSTGLRVYNDDMIAGLAPYKNCPVGNYGWPTMQEANKFGKNIVAPVSLKAAFGKARTIKTVGHGTQHISQDGETDYNTIEWTLTLKRVS